MGPDGMFDLVRKMQRVCGNKLRSIAGIVSGTARSIFGDLPQRVRVFNGCGRPISGVVKMGRFARGAARAGQCSEQPYSPSRNQGGDLVGSLLESRRYGMAIGSALPE